MSNFPNRMRELRSSRHFTQDDLSKRLGISKSTISMYENGNREPDFETLELIADFFNVDMNYLIGKTTVASSSLIDIDSLAASEYELLSYFRQLNDAGQEIALATVGSLVASRRYAADDMCP